MRVIELIEELQKYNPDECVVVDGVYRYHNIKEVGEIVYLGVPTIVINSGISNENIDFD